MTRRHLLIALACSLSGLGQAPELPAQEKKREWTPEHPYNISPQAGPWAICVMSYSGYKAFSLSEKFVTELRRDYKLPGYFFNRSDVDRQKELERQEELRKKRWAFYEQLAKQTGANSPEEVAPKTHWVKRPLHIEDQYAVLIGGYRDMETARRSLEYVRKLKEPSDELMNKAFVVGPASGGAEVKSAHLNPFKTAFVVPNPTAPKPKQPEPDEKEQAYTLKELNADESFSLLNCPGQWTLVVKVYRAPTVVLSANQDRGLFGKSARGGEYLHAAARQAHQLAEVLRSKQLDFEAYVLHTNNMSMVTVGSFEGTSDPRMEPMANKLAKLKLEPFETLMSPPMPFKVPR